MARIRTIKPSFFTSETISLLTPEERLTFIGLWTHVDDDGRCVDNPRLIRAALWPLDERTDDDLDDDLGALNEHSLITRYTAAGKRYLAVKGWREHQVINRRTKSKYPAPEDGEPTPARQEDPIAPVVQLHLIEASVSTHGAITEDSRQEGKGREGKKHSLKPAAVKNDDPDFAKFWETYPRRVGRQSALKSWAKAITVATPDRIIAAAASYRDDGTRRRAEVKYTAHPATWLNAGRWDDEPDEQITDRQQRFPWEN